VSVRSESYFSRPCDFTVTDEGRTALVSAEACECIDLLVADGCFQCRECGTIYGVVNGWSHAPRRNHWRRTASIGVV